jgi:hypothetical protein
MNQAPSTPPCDCHTGRRHCTCEPSERMKEGIGAKSSIPSFYLLPLLLEDNLAVPHD